MTDILSRFGFPESSRIGQRIPKKLFAESSALTGADRRMFQKDVDEARCAYLLDCEKTTLSSVVDIEHDYSCFAVIDLTLKSPLHADKIAPLCHRTMPYPLLVVMHEEANGVKFSMAEKRMSRDGHEGTVLEKTVITPWFLSTALDDFFAASFFANAHGRDFLALHRWYFDRLEALNAAQVTGNFKPNCQDAEKRRAALAAIHTLDGQIAELKRQAKKVLTLSQSIELNIQIKDLERKRTAKVMDLS